MTDTGLKDARKYINEAKIKYKGKPGKILLKVLGHSRGAVAAGFIASDFIIKDPLYKDAEIDVELTMFDPVSG